MKKIFFVFLGVLFLASCDDDSTPDGTGYTTINYLEPTTSACPYCGGTGIIVDYYGQHYCPSCGGNGQITNISFKSRGVKTLKKNKKCPTKNSTFECIDEHNNGIISSTDTCIHCKHCYYVHK